MKGTTRAVVGVAALVLGVLTAGPAHAAARPLELGIYPGGYAGGGSTDGKPDDPVRITKALDHLQAGPGFLVREYVGYDGHTTDGTDSAKYLRYLGGGRRMDLVVEYPGHDTPLDGWLTYVRNEVRFAGPFSASISLGVDVNIAAGEDPSVVPAVVAGIEAAKDEARRLGYQWLQIGFDEVPFGVADTAFWQALATAGGDKLRDAIDFVGVEVYPDVFQPAPGDLGAQAVGLIQIVREQEMPIAGLTVPIHVSENGWDTVAPRTEQEQAAALTAELTAINNNRARLNITAYEYFDLRDDKTVSDNLFDHFGLLHDDYSPKPAFDTYRHLIRSLR
jgi:hypothetical protein